MTFEEAELVLTQACGDDADFQIERSAARFQKVHYGTDGYVPSYTSVTSSLYAIELHWHGGGPGTGETRSLRVGEPFGPEQLRGAVNAALDALACWRVARDAENAAVEAAGTSLVEAAIPF